MDNLTHSLVGVLLARTGVTRRAPRPMLLGVVAANMPDVDLVAGLDAPNYLHWHRHWTHAIPAIPLMALAAAALAWGVDRLLARARGRPPAQWRWRTAWTAALVPAASHPLLDAMNSYAIRPWLPFSGEWASFHALFVVDLFVWAGLATAALAPWAARLAGRGSAGLKRRAAWAGLATLALYAGWKVHSHGRVEAALRGLEFDGRPASRVAAFPAPFDPRAWTGYAEVGQTRYVLRVRVDRLGEIDPTAARRYPPPADEEAVERAWATDCGRAYREFSRYPIPAVEPTPAGKRVTLADARFGRPGRPGLACVVELNGDGSVRAERFAF